MNAGTLDRQPGTGGMPRYLSGLIILLVLALVGAGVWTFYRWTVRTPTITPEQADITALQQLIAQRPKELKYVTALGYTYQKAGKLAEARQQYLKVLKVEPKNMASLYNMGIIAQAEKKFPEAETYYKKVLKINAKHYLATMGLAGVYLDTGKYDLAIQKAEILNKQQSQSVDPHLLKAMALEKKGKKAEAKIEYQKVLQFIPSQEDAKQAMERLK